MELYRHKVGLDQSLLHRLAAWLLDHAPGAEQGGASDILVLLPAVRACATLRQLLLEVSETEAMLLPIVTTPAHLAEELTRRFDPVRPSLPATMLRAALLAPRLAQLPWVKEHPESAPGLAEEFVTLFDEIRQHELQTVLLTGESETDLPSGESRSRSPVQATWQHATSWLANVPDQHLVLKDLERIAEAWQIYRQVIPRDEIDQLQEVTSKLSAQGWPGPEPGLLVMAGFAHLDPATARLLHEIMVRTESHLFESVADDPLSGLFLASYGDTQQEPDRNEADDWEQGPTGDATHPLYPGRAVRDLLWQAERSSPQASPGDRAGPQPRRPLPSERPPGHDRKEPPTFREQLADLEPAWRRATHQHQIELLSSDDPEQESRAVTAMVVQAIQGWQEGSAPLTDTPPRIAVATADRDLARRVTAQLRDTGLDFDDTGGVALAELPAGLLAQHLLQAVVSGFHYGPLLELMTHPFVDLVGSAQQSPVPDPTPTKAESLTPERREHTLKTLRFEKMIRGGQRPLTGLEGYLRLAAEWDGKARKLDRPWQGDMSALVRTLAETLAPLNELASGHHSWRVYLAGFRRVWHALAPGRPLDPAASRQDEAALARLVEELEDAISPRSQAARSEPRTSCADFAAMLIRCLADRIVRPHRRPFLPVVVTGLLEARLERYDLLILAGLSEEIFPGRQARPLFLGETARRQLGLPDWRAALGRQADLFLRLLHNGIRTVLTWPAERSGQPCLPSPFVIRTGLSGHLPASHLEPQPLYRRTATPHQEIAADQQSFAAEPVEIPVATDLPPLDHLSHTSLKTYRDCPYRFLLETGYGLREAEEVLEAFRRLDYGNLVHKCLREFLEPASPGPVALAAGQVEVALANLQNHAVRNFAEGAADMPQRRLWEETFLALCRPIVDFEMKRFTAGWRPVFLEQKFEFTLGDLQAWLQKQGDRSPGDGQAVSPPQAAQDLMDFRLKGTIDRIDRLVQSHGDPASGDVENHGDRFAVIDYKTGMAPTGTEVKEGRDLQVVLYALAVEVGGLQGLSADSHPQVMEGAYYQVNAARCGFNLQKPHLAAGDHAGRKVLVQGAELILDTAEQARRLTGHYPLIPEQWQGVSTGSLPCQYCPYRAVCRLEERDLSPGLQRLLASQLVRIPEA